MATRARSSAARLHRRARDLNGRKAGAAPRHGLRLFAQSLAPDDRVALEVTSNAWAIARILEARVSRVVVVTPSDEFAYRRNVADWQATRPTKAGASATQGHASQEPSKG